jgi:hypothetical protein
LRDFRHRDPRSALLPQGLSEGPRYTDIQILRAGRTKESEQRNEKAEPEENTHRKRINTQPKAIHKNKARQHRQKNKPYPQPKQKNKNFTQEKETMGVLHPASRLTPENGGIPPFYGRNKLNVRVLCRYR